MENNVIDKKTENRIDWIDCCKGFAMLFVVIGHVADGYIAAEMFSDYTVLMAQMYDICYSFHMPLFFVMSGYVFHHIYIYKNNYNVKKFKISIFNLLWIYFLFSIIQWVFKMIFSSSVVRPIGVEDLLLIPINPIDQYWYIYVMIVFYIAFYFFERVKLSEKIKFIILAGVSCLSVFVVGFFEIHNIMLFGVFFYSGMLMSKFKFNSESLGKCKNVILLLLVAVSIVIEALLCIFNAYILHRSPLGILSSAVVVATIILLFSVKNINNRILKICGIYSLEIYLTHCFINAANRKLLPTIGIENFFLNFIINTIMSTVIPILCAMLLKKMNLHIWIFRPFKKLISDSK